MKMTCENKVAIVTGAAGTGMGRSIALTLAREGARVQALLSCALRQGDLLQDAWHHTSLANNG